jgi:two-component system alkaline phosphatase synthesis response regulator PhoP
MHGTFYLRIDLIMSDYILFVDDDDPDAHGTVYNALDQAGLKSLKATSGQLALRQIRENPPRAIVLDLMMPSMNGFSTLTRLQHDQVAHNIPIILLSSMPDQSRHMAYLPGVIGVLPKGRFSLQEFFKLLKRAGIWNGGGLPGS